MLNGGWSPGLAAEGSGSRSLQVIFGKSLPLSVPSLPFGTKGWVLL